MLSQRHDRQRQRLGLKRGCEAWFFSWTSLRVHGTHGCDYVEYPRGMDAIAPECHIETNLGTKINGGVPHIDCSLTG